MYIWITIGANVNISRTNADRYKLLPSCFRSNYAFFETMNETPMELR